MPHTDEPPITERAAAQFRERYGADNVEQEVYLEESGRYCDIVVDARERGGVLEPDYYVVEVENDPDEAIYSVGQTLVYEEEVDDENVSVEPVIVVPDGHTEDPEMEHLEDDVRFVELPPGVNGAGFHSNYARSLE